MEGHFDKGYGSANDHCCSCSGGYTNRFTLDKKLE